MVLNRCLYISKEFGAQLHEQKVKVAVNSRYIMRLNEYQFFTKILYFDFQNDLCQAIYVPADDLTDPAPATTFAHLDATTVLSRAIAELGIYPAVDPLDSTSRIMDPNIVGREHYDVARGVQKILQVSCQLHFPQ